MIQKIACSLLFFIVLTFIGCGGDTIGTNPGAESSETSEQSSSEEIQRSSSETLSVSSSSILSLSSSSQVISESSDIPSDNSSSFESSSMGSANESSSVEISSSTESSAISLSSLVESSSSVMVNYATLEVEAESYVEQGGTTGVQRIYGDSAIGYFGSGDWMKFESIDFGSVGMKSVVFETGKKGVAEGSFEVRIDSLNGPVIGFVVPNVTGEWRGFENQIASLEATTGTHDLYLRGLNFGDEGVCNIDKFTLSEEPVSRVPNILFVGNSYTYYWEMPEILEALAESQDVQLNITRSTLGGAWWDAHFANAGVGSADLIQTGNFDYVVLQNNSRSSLQESRFMEYGVEMIKLIRDAGATPLLYMTWSRRWETDTLGQSQAANGINIDPISTMYRKLADSMFVDVIPVGEVWQSVKDANNVDFIKTMYRQSELNDSGGNYFGSHPSAIGSYLIASIFYSAFTGNNVAELPLSLTVPNAITDPMALESIVLNVDATTATIFHDAIETFSMGLNLLPQ